jgi:branched-chain amino acid transport system permease protein
VIFGAIPPVLREFANPELQWIIYGMLMIAVVFFMPEGIVPALYRLGVRYRLIGRPLASAVSAERH